MSGNNGKFIKFSSIIIILLGVLLMADAILNSDLDYRNWLGIVGLFLAVFGYFVARQVWHKN